MRNLLDKSSVAQSLDGDRLMGSLHFPLSQVSKLNAPHTQQDRFAEARFGRRGNITNWRAAS
jgi:hypothetical protein